MSEPKLLSADELARMRLWALMEWDASVDGEREAEIAQNQIHALYAHIDAQASALLSLERKLEEAREALAAKEEKRAMWDRLAHEHHETGQRYWEALRALVRLKDRKDAGFKTYIEEEAYRVARDKAWAAARNLLSRADDGGEKT